jgi:hypothetical protein
MRAWEKKEQESEWQRDEFFNKLWPTVPRQQWRAKAVSEALKKTRVDVLEERGATDVEVPVETKVNWFDWPATPVGPIDMGSAQDRSGWPTTPARLVNEVLVQTIVEIPTFSQSCSEVPAPIEDEEEMLDYEPSLVWEDMDVNVIYLLIEDYSIVGDDEVAEMSFGPHDAMF